MTDVLAVLILLAKETLAGNAVLQLAELIEEWTREVQVTTIRKWIPSVTPPAIAAIHGKGGIRWIHGKQITAAQIAPAMEILPLITPYQSALLPAIRTKCGRGDIPQLHAGPLEFREKRLIEGGDFEGLGTPVVGANALHRTKYESRIQN